MDAPLPENSLLVAFEREKWEAAERRLDREFELKASDLAFRVSEARRARLWNPLAIAILGASIAAAGSAFVSWQNSNANLEVETFKAESARIFEVVKTGDPDLAARNLGFLLEIGLIQNPLTTQNINTYLDKRKKGEGINLPASLPNITTSYCLTSNLNAPIPCNATQEWERMMKGIQVP